jgi:hypothetical protein
MAGQPSSRNLVDIVEKVLKRLGTTESTTLAFKREDGGKIRVTSLLWEAPLSYRQSREVSLLPIQQAGRSACE